MPITNDIERLHGRIAELEARIAKMEGVTDEGWITWSGGDCPVPYAENVRVCCSNGDIRDLWSSLDLRDQRWAHNGGDEDIIAYRVVK